MTPLPQRNYIIRYSLAFLLGGIVSAVSIIATITILGMSFGPKGFPVLPENARRDAEEFARLTPFPRMTSELSMSSRGGPFGHQLQVAFFGDKEEVSKWVDSCPGVKDKKIESHRNDDGSIRYVIPPRPLASGVSSELTHHPDRGTVIVTLFYK